MNPDTRMAISLVFSLVVSAQNLRMAAAGEADIVDVGVRYVVAFLAAFVVVGIAGRVFNSYLEAHEIPDGDADDAVGGPVDGTGFGEHPLGTAGPAPTLAD